MLNEEKMITHKWVRLTPFIARGSAFAEFRQRDGFDCVNIRAGYSRVTLTHAELNALARLAPDWKKREEQIKALVVDVETLRSVLITSDLWGKWKDWTELLRKRLAPFTEDSDE